MEEGPSNSIFGVFRSLFRRIMNGGAHVEKFEDEIQDLIDQGAEQGLISPGEGEMIQSIVEFRETVAREIMVPRISMVSCPADTTLKQAIETILKYGHTRIPIHEKDVDHIIGILHAKDLLAHWDLPAQTIVPREIVRPAHFVPENKRIVELLGELRARKSHMAIILDEYGGTAGLVTLEDIIEEIIGEIQDEYDREEEMIKPLDDQTSIVDARLNVEDLSSHLGIELPDGEYDTLGGFITDLMGRVPKENEQVQFKDLTLTIRSADERKINRVEIKRPLSSNGVAVHPT